MRTTINGRFDILVPSYFLYYNSIIENVHSEGSSGIFVSSTGAEFLSLNCVFRNCVSTKLYGPLVSNQSKVFNVSRCYFSHNYGGQMANLYIYDDGRFGGSTNAADFNLSSLNQGKSPGYGDYISAKTLTSCDINSSSVHGSYRYCSISYTWFMQGDTSMFPSLKRISVFDVIANVPAIELVFFNQKNVTWSLYNFNVKNCSSSYVFTGGYSISFIFDGFVFDGINASGWFEGNLIPLFRNCYLANLQAELVKVNTEGVYIGNSFYIPGDDLLDDGIAITECQSKNMLANLIIFYLI